MAEGNKLQQVDMAVERLAIDNSASFRKLKDFPIVSNKLKFSTSTPHHSKDQPLPVVDLVADKSSLNNESNLNNKHSEIQNAGSSYQIIGVDILASTTYSVISCPDCFNASCEELKKVKKEENSWQLY